MTIDNQKALEEEICTYCGAIIKKVDGPVHEYLKSSLGCWSNYCRVLEKEYSDQKYMKVHRLTVDTYACQHIGEDTPKSNQSTIVHLAASNLALDLGWNLNQIPRVMEAHTVKHKGSLERLSQLNFSCIMNITDVVLTKDSDIHSELIYKWAHEVWHAWSHKQKKISRLVNDLF